MPHSLILTATITPPSGVSNLVRADPSVRLNDYAEALEFYLKLPSHLLSRIVFADNSNSDVSKLQELADKLGAGKDVRIISFEGLDHPASYGRGYGEMKLMDRILGPEGPVADLPPDTVFWKGTGRYKLLNMARLIETAPRSFGLYCDLKNRPLVWFDMRFFAFTKDWYARHLQGRHLVMREDLQDGDGAPGSSVPEIVLRGYIDRHVDMSEVVPRFRVEPFIDGVRSFDTKSFVSLKNLPKYWIRKTARVLTPRVWI